MASKNKFTIMRDSREKSGCGWKFRASGNCYGMAVAKLNAGDYSIYGYEHLVMIERKTISDLWTTLVHHRKRFIKQMERCKDHPFKYLVIEGTVADILKGFRYSRVTPKTILAMLTSLEVKYGVHVIYTSKRTDIAQEYVRKLLAKLFDYCEEGVYGKTAG